MSLDQPQWVYVKEGTIIPLPNYPENVPAGVTPKYRVNATFYDSKDSYEQMTENARIQGIAAKARFDANPGGYPPCSNDPPTGPEEQCGSESCDMHNILWLEYDGCDHEQAIGLTAVYNFADSWGYGPVADTLGGMDEFNTLNENGPDMQGMIEWYNAHQPLVYYIMEIREKDDLWDYWWHAKNPDHLIPERGRISIHLIKGPNGQWQPYQAPGQPLLAPESYDDWLANYDATKASMTPEMWANHTVGHFEFTK